MTPAELEAAFEAGQWKPVHLFHGPDRPRLEKFLKKAAKLVKEGFEDFNLQHLQAEDTPPGELLEQARTMPFIQGPRVIILKGLDAYSAEEQSLILDYLEDPNLDACLILVADKPNFNLKFYRKLRKMNLETAFEAPKGRELAAWIVDAAKNRGMEINQRAAQTLIDQLGADLSELEGEVEKLCLYALDRKRIVEEDVIAAARVGPTSNVFILGDAVGEQNPAKALASLKDLMSSQPALPVLIMLIRHLRLLLKAKALDDRAPLPDRARALGLPPFIAQKYLEQARGLTLEEIRKGLALLQEANLTLFRSSAPERLIMDKLVLDLTSLRRSRRPRPAI